jgi:hypothetical protein
MSDELTDEQILCWFESADLAQCLVTHAMAQGILRMRQQQNGRKRRSDAGKSRKSDEAQPRLLDRAGDM